MNAPDTLWYQCSSHSGMLGQLNIRDAYGVDGDSVVSLVVYGTTQYRWDRFCK